MNKLKTLNALSSEGAKYIVVKKNETYFWERDIAIKAGQIDGIYLIDLTKPTNLCEFEISYPAHFIKNSVANWMVFDENELADIEKDSGGDDITYFKGDSMFEPLKIYSKGWEWGDAKENEATNPTVC